MPAPRSSVAAPPPAEPGPGRGAGLRERSRGARRAWGLIGLLLIVEGTALAGSSPRGSGEERGVWQLLVDDSLVAERQNLRRTYHPFTKHPGNPVLVADRPWEGQMAYLYGTVLPTPGGRGYQMWYHSWAGEYRNLFATSVDGMTWTKPALDLIDFNGSKANNLFLRRTKEDHLPQVIHTPWEKAPERRYKLLNYDYGRSGPGHSVSGFWGAYSPDGVHWTDVAENPVLKDPGDVGHFVWDPHGKRYVGYPKVFAPVRGFRRRCVGFTATRDFEHWPSAQLILAPDEADDRWVAGQNQRTEFYGLCGFAYESAYLGFLWIFRITDGRNDGPIYPELVSSRDGIRWTRPDPAEGGRVPILGLGPAEAWDRGMIFTPNQPVVEGGVIKLWYGGIDITHGGPDAQGHGGIGLATLRKDGFASLDAAEAEGWVTTRALKNLRGPLRVNADARGGWIKVEVLTIDGRVCPGYGRDDCDAIRGDAIDQAVTWGRRRELPRSGGPQRLRFVMQHASLYSFAAGSGLAVAEPEAARPSGLTFEEETRRSEAFRTRLETIRPLNGDHDVPYVLLEPSRRAGSGRAPLLIYLYGAGGSHEDYNLMRPPYDRVREGLAALGYYVLVPELGPLHWMNPPARLLLDQMVDQVLARHPIDPRQIQVMGTSMGGGSALAYAIQRPDRVRAVCCHMGMTDFEQWLVECPRYWGTITQAYGGSPAQMPAVYRGQSAMANLDVFAHIPVLYIAGETDQTVLPQQGRRLVGALGARGYSAVYREAKGVGHEDRTMVGFEDELVDFFRMTGGQRPTYRLHHGATLQADPARAAFGSGAVALGGASPGKPNTVELLGTTQLGACFTLAATVKTSGRRLMRLFSNHCGSGAFVSGELVFDFDPSGAAIPGLRFVANGQAVKSGPANWETGRYHHLAVTYDRGRVVLYLDGAPVGAGVLQAGAAHLYYDRTVLRHFDRPAALPEVGIRLASNLHVGGDAGGTFVTYEDEVLASTEEQLVGDVDEVFVAPIALAAEEVRRLARKGLDLCKLTQ